MKKYIRVLMFLIISVLVQNVFAASVRLDDSGTVVGRAQTKMEWTSPSQSNGDFYQLMGQTMVNARINVRQWNGRAKVRIYMGLESAAINNLVVSWKSSGYWMPGVIKNNNTSNSRALVYEGPINTDYLTETLNMSITADGRSYSKAQNLKFYFEIE